MKYAIPIFVMTVTTNSIYMSDVILVKHFFDGHLAGIYAALSTMGKIIFYGTAPVASVMFPLVSKSYAKGGNYRKIFLLSLLITSIMAFGLIFIYWLFPSAVLTILYGNKFIEGSKYLVWFGIFIGLFSISTLFLNYFLSKGTTKITYVGLVAALIQIIGIVIFHRDITQVIWVSISVSLTLLAILVIYFWYEVGIYNNSVIQSGKDNSKDPAKG